MVQYNIEASSATFSSNNNIDNITLYSDGRIKINGNVKTALKYIINTIFTVYEDTYYKEKIITITNIIKIDLSKLEIKYFSDKSIKEFEAIKAVIDQVVFKKIRMKSFW